MMNFWAAGELSVIHGEHVGNLGAWGELVGHNDKKGCWEKSVTYAEHVGHYGTVKHTCFLKRSLTCLFRLIINWKSNQSIDLTNPIKLFPDAMVDQGGVATVTELVHVVARAVGALADELFLTHITERGIGDDLWKRTYEQLLINHWLK